MGFVARKLPALELQLCFWHCCAPHQLVLVGAQVRLKLPWMHGMDHDMDCQLKHSGLYTVSCVQPLRAEEWRYVVCWQCSWAVLLTWGAAFAGACGRPRWRADRTPVVLDQAVWQAGPVHGSLPLYRWGQLPFATGD